MLRQSAKPMKPVGGTSTCNQLKFSNPRPKYTRAILIVLFTSVMALSGCRSNGSETPAEGSQAQNPNQIATTAPTTPTSSSATGAALPSTTTTATAPSGFKPVAGTWKAHEMTLVIDDAGNGHLSYPDFLLCPNCSFGGAPVSNVAFVLTIIRGETATGTVTVSSDPQSYSPGEQVTATVSAGSPGQVLNITVGTTTLVTFCNNTSVGECGA